IDLHRKSHESENVVEDNSGMKRNEDPLFFPNLGKMLRKSVPNYFYTSVRREVGKTRYSRH
ncbi:hypothetical protein AVEN_239980-1, partial [Araneus ventricosus]